MAPTLIKLGSGLEVRVTCNFKNLYVVPNSVTDIWDMFRMNLLQWNCSLFVSAGSRQLCLMFLVFFQLQHRQQYLYLLPDYPLMFTMCNLLFVCISCVLHLINAAAFVSQCLSVSLNVHAQVWGLWLFKFCWDALLGSLSLIMMTGPTVEWWLG